MPIDPRNAADPEAECLTAYDVIGEVLASIPPSPPRCIQDLRDGKCYVYFIGGEGTPIKIGMSFTPYERLASLQTAHWVKLSILAKVEGSFETEGAYHRQFAGSRMAGEWFKRTPELLAEIERLSE